jgi:tetratricopeptide (TPR) repeat protein/TolB-like protein
VIFLGAVAALLLIPGALERAKDLVGLDRAPALTRVAVLPFTTATEDPADRAFCDGLADYLSSRLASTEPGDGSLQVIPFSRVSEKVAADPAGAHQALGSSIVISGNMRRNDDVVRLTLARNDVDWRTGGMNRTAQFTLSDPLANLATWQDSVVVGAARLAGLDEEPVAGTGGGTTLPAAYELHLLGRGVMRGATDTEGAVRAIALLDSAIALDPSYAGAHATLAEACCVHARLGGDSSAYGRARDACRHSLRLRPEAASYVTMGTIYRGLDSLHLAMESYARAIELNPLAMEAYRQLARCYHHQGNAASEEAVYRSAMEARPLDPMPHKELGVRFVMNGDYEGAVEELRKVIDLEPGKIWAYNNLGACFFYTEDLDEAQKMFERSLEIQPNYVAYCNLATLEFYKSRYAEAARLYEHALDLRGNDYRLWGDLATCYYWTGRREEAVDIYNRAAGLARGHLKMVPEDVLALADLASYRCMMGQDAEAGRLLARVVEMEPRDREAVFRVGEIYEMLGERERALEWLGRAVEMGYSPVALERYPGLKDLRSDDRFRRLIADGRPDG